MIITSSAAETPCKLAQAPPRSLLEASALLLAAGKSGQALLPGGAASLRICFALWDLGWFPFCPLGGCLQGNRGEREANRGEKKKAMLLKFKQERESERVRASKQSNRRLSPLLNAAVAAAEAG